MDGKCPDMVKEMAYMYEMEPPNPRPNPPKRAKKCTRSRQSSRCDRMAMAMAARAPGIHAPDSCPKFPRIPHPIDKDKAIKKMLEGFHRGFLIARSTVRSFLTIPRQGIRPFKQNGQVRSSAVDGVRSGHKGETYCGI